MARITVIVSENPRFVKRGFFLIDISVIMCYSIDAATGVSITRSNPPRQTEGNGAPLSCLGGSAWKAGRAEYPRLLFLYPHPPPAPRGGSAAPRVTIEDYRRCAIEGRSLTSESNVSSCIYPRPTAESNVPPPPDFPLYHGVKDHLRRGTLKTHGSHYPTRGTNARRRRRCASLTPAMGSP